MSLIIRNIRDARIARFDNVPLSLIYRHKKFPLSSVVATDIIAGNGPSKDRCIIYKGYVEDDPSTQLALKFVQGSVLPRCYGLASLDNVSGCLITQHWGTSLHTPLKKLPRPEKKTILTKLAELHADKSRAIFRQVHHSHIPKNSDGEVRILNPSYIDFDHKGCNNLDMRWLDTPLDSWASEEALSMCFELWHNAYDRLAYYVFRPQAGVPFSMDKLPQSIIDELDPHLGSRSDRCRRQITDLEEEPIQKLYYERIYWLLDDHMAAELYHARDVIFEEVIVKWGLDHPVEEFCDIETDDERRYGNREVKQYAITMKLKVN